MKTTININGEDVEIVLTPEQIETIKQHSIPIMERIISLPAALAYNGKTQEQFDWETERDTDQQKATKELEEIALALREGKELEMGDKWYYPWMRKPVAGSGSRFSCSGYVYGHVCSNVGARLSVDTSEKAIYMGKQFPEIYTRHLSPRTK